MLPCPSLWMLVIKHYSYHRRCKTDIHGRSVDAHFYGGVGRVSLSLLPIKVANNLFMNICNLSHVRLPRMPDEKSFTLHWCSFSGCRMELVNVIFVYIGGEYFDYVLPQPNQFLIWLLTRAKIVYAPLMLISPQAYPQYAIIWFGIVYHSDCFGSLSCIFIYFLLDHYIVL